MAEIGKNCTMCGIFKPYGDFHRKKSMKDGFRSACKSCTIEQNRDYAKNNTDKVTESKRKYREANRELLRIKARKYNALNTDKRTISVYNWRKKYAERDKTKRVIQAQRRRARMRILPHDFTASEWSKCLTYFDNSCCYCGKVEDVLHQDHFVPVSKGGGYTVSNIVPACLSCNSAKKDKDFLEWYKSRDYYSEQRYEKINHYLSSVKPEVA